MWSYLSSSEYNTLGEKSLPGRDIAGGGTRTKTLNIQKAGIPVINRVPLCETFGLLVEPLSLNKHPDTTSSNEAFNLNLNEIKERRGTNVIWTEEQQLLRWTGSKRDELLANADALLVCNNYLKNLLRAFIQQPIYILRTPIDQLLFRPADAKKKRVVATSRVCIQKNIRDIITLFSHLPSTWEKVFIGNANLWGQPPTPVDLKLEGELANVCDWIPTLSQQGIADLASDTLAYVNMSRYDVGCLSFLEFSMAGCHCFCWNYHPMFDEYVGVQRFISPLAGAEMIQNVINEYGDEPNAFIREMMIGNHSYTAFRQQLKELTLQVAPL